MVPNSGLVDRRLTRRSAEAVQEYAAEADVDLIVAGERGVDSVAEAILGSTGDRLVGGAGRPATIVSAADD